MNHHYSHDYRILSIIPRISKAKGYEGTKYYDITFRNLNNKQTIRTEVSSVNGNFAQNGWDLLIKAFQEFGDEYVWTMHKKMINRRNGKASNWSVFTRNGEERINADSQIMPSGKLVVEVVNEHLLGNENIKETDGIFEWDMEPKMKTTEVISRDL